MAQANRSKEATEKASELEKIQISALSAITNEQATINISDLEKEIENNGLDKSKLTQTPSGFRYYSNDVDYKITSSGIVKILEKNQVDFDDVLIGTTISNYTCDKETNTNIVWKIFCHDNNNVYIIPSRGTEWGALGSLNGNIASKEEIPYRYQGFTELETYKNTKFQIYNTNMIDSIKTKINSSLRNAKAVEYLLDNDNWSEYTNGNFADWAIGGPTAEMIRLALIQENAISSLIIGEWENYGFKLTLKDGPLTRDNICSGNYWIACQSLNNMGYGIWRMSNDTLSGYRYYDSDCSFRPIVRLNNSVKFFDYGNNEYIITEKSNK